MTRILAIDIETAPAAVYTFNLFKPVIGHNQIIEPGRILCFSAQWRGDKKVQFYSEHEHGQGEMLKTLHSLLDDADIVLHFNGASFDIPWIEGELMLAGFQPPSPFRQVDLFQFIKRHSRMISKKLDYVAHRFLDEQKVSHSGFQLWVDCMNGDEKAWRLMKKYAIKDTKLLLPLYEKIKGWMPNHPNVALIDAKEFGCPKCGSEHAQKRGLKFTNASAFQQYQCQDCGGWFRVSTRSYTTASRN